MAMQDNAASTTATTVTIPAERSAFTYEPPPDADPQELIDFNNSLKSSIDSISDEFSTNNTDETEAGDETKPEVDEKPAELDETKLTEFVPADRGLDRLVQREVAIQQREAQVAQREATIKALEQELANLRQAVPSQDLLAKFDNSPSDAFKAIGKDPETMVRLMIAEQLHARGEKVPEGLQKFVEQAESNRRIEVLERQLAQRDQAAKEQQIFSAVNLGAREYAKTIETVVDSSKKKLMPTLADVYKADPELVHDELMEVINRAAKDSNSELTYQMAALKAEERLARLRKALNPVANTTQPTKPDPGQQTKPPVTKPPVKPLRPWEQRRTDLDAAIREATNEFHKSEAAQRAAAR